MNTQHLRYVVEVEKACSITKAAHNLYMGQPNLSKAIKELESELGISIFKRTAKGVEPTRQGAEFLGYARTILAQIDELESLYKPHGETSVSLNLSVPRATYIAAAFSKFLNHYAAEDHLNIRYRETSSLDAINDIVSGESDFGVIRCQEIYESYFMRIVREHGLKAELVWQFPMSVLMSDKHPLAVYDDIPYHLLGRYTELVHPDDQAPPVAFSHIRRDAKLETPRKTIAVYDRGVQFDLLQKVNNTFMWVSPIPMHELAEKHLVLRGCTSAQIKSRDYLVTDPRRPLNRHESLFAEELLRFVREEKLAGAEPLETAE